MIKLIKQVLLTEAYSIIKTSDNVNENFTKAIELLHNCKNKICVIGVGKSGLIGQKIVATFNSINCTAVFIHPTELMHGDLGLINKEDIIILISNSGETKEIVQILPYLKENKKISITSKKDSLLDKSCDLNLNIIVEKEADDLNIVPTTSTTVTLAVGDALAVALMKKKNFTKDNFLSFHPAGSLGKGLSYKVKDIMIRKENLPLLNIKTDFKDALNYMSEMNLGILLINNNEGKLIGIFTDGDLRRTIQKYDNISDIKLEDIITTSFKNISEDSYLIDSIKLMEQNRISSLIVLNSNKELIGLICMKDIIKI